MEKIIAIHAVQQGNGTTIIALNIAALLASQGKRVCIVDANFFSPRVTRLLGVPDEKIHRTMNDYLQGKCDAIDTLIQISSAKVEKNGGKLFIAPASMNIKEVRRISHEGYDEGVLNDSFRDIGAQGFDYLVLDTPAGTEECSLLMIVISNILLEISRPVISDYQKLAVDLDVAKRIDVPRAYILINKVHYAYDVDDVKRGYENTYQCSVASLIVHSDQLSDFNETNQFHEKQEFFALEYPDSQFTQELQKCAALVL